MLDFFRKFFRPVVKVVMDEPDKMPCRASSGAAGLDVYCTRVEYDRRRGQYTCHTGLHVEIPAGYFGMVCPRSSIVRKGVRLANCVGVIDSDYRGEITFVFDRVNVGEAYHAGERIGQLLILPCPQVDFVQTASLSPTRRGTGGYGSTGTR